MTGKSCSFITLYVVFRNGCRMPVPISRLVISIEVTGTAEDTGSETWYESFQQCCSTPLYVLDPLSLRWLPARLLQNVWDTQEELYFLTRIQKCAYDSVRQTDPFFSWMSVQLQTKVCALNSFSSQVHWSGLRFCYL